MQKVKSYVLPIAIVLGLLLHDYCAALSVVVPYIIFTIILLTFTAVDILKLRFKPLFAWIILFQVGVSIGGYALLRLLNVNEIIAEGVLIGVLCPVAASVAVVSTMLGADRNTVTSYTVIGNFFSFIGVNQDIPFFDSFLQILRRIGTVIGLPFFVALALQLLWPKANHFISRYKGLAFYLWAVALFLTLGQTIHFIFINGKGNWNSILGQMDWAQIWRHDCWRAVVRTEKFRNGHLDGQPLPPPFSFGLSGLLFGLPEPVQQLADLVLWAKEEKCIKHQSTDHRFHTGMT